MQNKRKQLFYSNYIVPYSYILPALLVFSLIIVYPAFTSLVLSFFNFSGFDSKIFKEFAAFENFNKLVADKYFWISLRNTFYFVGGSVILQTSIAMFISMLIFFGNFRHSILLRSIIFLPGILAPVSISLAWRRILAQEGVINQILNTNVPWLSNAGLAIWLVVMVSIWQWVGYNTVIFYAGLQSIDLELIEAADVDGASWRIKLFRLVVPCLVPTIMLNAILNLIGSFRAFDIVYVLTRGGPAHYSEVLTTFMYYYTFASNGPSRMGVGSAVALIMFIIMIIFGFIRIILLKKSEL
ncbi:MAG: sugar ABC transporter permease [Spirochaetota bacterium]